MLGGPMLSAPPRHGKAKPAIKESAEATAGDAYPCSHADTGIMFRVDPRRSLVFAGATPVHAVARRCR